MSDFVTEQTRPGRRSRPPRKRRLATKLVMVALVLVGLLVAADFGLAAAAEHTVSQKAREQLDLRTDPNVTVHGFPFLTQAVSGEYDDITVRAKGIDVNDVLRNVAFQADLRDVRAPLSDLLSGDVSNVEVGELEGRVKLTESVIANIPPLSKIENLNIEPTTEEYVRKGEAAEMDPQEARKQGAQDDTGDSANTNSDDGPSTTGIRISGDVRIAGDKVEIYAFAIAELAGSTINIEPERLQFARSHETTVVPPKVQEALLPDFRVNINAAELPFTVTPTAIRVNSGSVIIKGKADDIRFSELAFQKLSQ